MPCKVCGKPADARCHLLPRAFVKSIRGDKQKALMGSARATGQKITQAGEFDDDLLCERHEAHLTAYDDYAITWIRRFDRHAVLPERFNGEFFVAPNEKPNLLLRFVASVIWRNAVSVRNRDHDMDLGPWESKLRELIFGESRYNPAMLIIKQDYLLDDQVLPQMIIPPARDDGYGKRGWSFEVGGFVWSMKLDDRTRGAIP